jgi:hypothetical protein
VVDACASARIRRLPKRGCARSAATGILYRRLAPAAAVRAKPLCSRLIALPEDKRHAVSEGVRRARRFVDTSDADPARRQAGLMRLNALMSMHCGTGALRAEMSFAQRIELLRRTVGGNDLINAMLGL